MLTPLFTSAGNIALLAFGFGFVIFWHEMGHFLAAKWAGVKVEQFAVGFGQALFSWRKGLGFRWGSSFDEYSSKVKKQHEDSQPASLDPKQRLESPDELQLAAAAAQLGISETEYRLNWIPLGGYVKMLGQDDLKPGQVVSDPRSYNNKSVGQRMVIVSAGVIMNVILAAFGFMYIFTVGIKVPPARIGVVQPGSPGQQAFRVDSTGKHIPAPLHAGDTVLTLNGKEIHSFEQLQLNTALLISGEPAQLEVEHPDKSRETVTIIPRKPDEDTEFPRLGLAGAYKLEAADKPADDKDPLPQSLPEDGLITYGDTITELNHRPITDDQFYQLDAAMQANAGQPIDITVKHSNGTSEAKKLPVHFAARFDKDPGNKDSINFLGLQMLAMVEMITPHSPAEGKLLPGDVVLSVADDAPNGDQLIAPAMSKLVEFIGKAGSSKTPLRFKVLRDNKPIEVQASPTMLIARGKYGLGISFDNADQVPITADAVDGSPAKVAGIPAGSKVVSINSRPINNWFDVNAILRQAKAGEPLEVIASANGKDKSYRLVPATRDIELAQQNTFASYAMAAMLKPAEETRVAPNHNPIIAAEWGIGETRDSILQVYQTVRAISKGSLSSKELSGPVGIMYVGYRVASLGPTRLVWFLSLISANLAVMNFLPIPVVDGGLFTFLILEKIKGSPINPRVQAIAQMVGIVILLSVLVFATVQDVARIPFMSH